jgi:hypothetical protein
MNSVECSVPSPLADRLSLKPPSVSACAHYKKTVTRLISSLIDIEVRPVPRVEGVTDQVLDRALPGIAHLER